MINTARYAGNGRMSRASKRNFLNRLNVTFGGIQEKLVAAKRSFEMWPARHRALEVSGQGFGSLKIARSVAKYAAFSIAVA